MAVGYHKGTTSFGRFSRTDFSLTNGSTGPLLRTVDGHTAKGVGELFLAEVVVQDGETVESALRRFKRKVQQEDIIKDIKRHSFYLKPGEKKRAKEALARKRSRKKARKEQD